MSPCCVVDRHGDRPQHGGCSWQPRWGHNSLADCPCALMSSSMEMEMPVHLPFSQGQHLPRSLNGYGSSSRPQRKRSQPEPVARQNAWMVFRPVPSPRLGARRPTVGSPGEAQRWPSWLNHRGVFGSQGLQGSALLRGSGMRGVGRHRQDVVRPAIAEHGMAVGGRWSDQLSQSCLRTCARPQGAVLAARVRAALPWPHRVQR